MRRSLTADQERALESLAAALAERRPPGGDRPAQRLLQGVTGSGKTEVYLRAAAIALEQGRGAIVLVPEIALTPQIVGRFLERFGDTVAVLHSRLRPAERYAEWRRLRTGEARVCVGPRSAVFAPIEELGLIVVDEEHDASYKHEGDPRYDARDVAAERARRSGALLLLGSATPRPESVRAVPAAAPAAPRRRPPAAAMCACSTCAATDRRSASRACIRSPRRRSRRCAGRGARRSCCSTAAAGRTSSPAARAGGCGAARSATWRSCCTAPRDASPATTAAIASRRRLAASAARPRSHATARAPSACSTTWRSHSATASVSRSSVWTPTSVTDGGGVGALLRRFEAAPAGVLIGTQMVAKGHDFPDVTLGVVLDADATLRFPDFRAEERTFALIAQLAGRVGRGGEGRVLVQTIAPDARAIVHAATHDSDGFLAGELERREALRYPPFSHLIRIVCSAPEAPRAQAAASAVADVLRERL